MLGNCGSEVAELGLKYVHNDTCYPGAAGHRPVSRRAEQRQVRSGAHRRCSSPRRAAAAAPPTTSICCARRCSQGRLRPDPRGLAELLRAGKGQRLPLTLPLARKAGPPSTTATCWCALRNQTQPYENGARRGRGAAGALAGSSCREVRLGKGSPTGDEAPPCRIAADFAAIPVRRVPKVKVGVVGEIYVKYSPLGNNDLEKFLASQDCEVNLPGMMGFVQYCAYNPSETARLYGGSFWEKHGSDFILQYFSRHRSAHAQGAAGQRLPRALPFKQLIRTARRHHRHGRQDGRGLAADGRDDRAGAGRLREHRLRPALRLPAQPHLSARA
jgi:hypothetical protein